MGLADLYEFKAKGAGSSFRRSSFRKDFEKVCESFGGEVEVEDGTLTCFLDGSDKFKAFSIWLHENAVKSKREGAYSAKRSTDEDLERGKMEFYVENGKGTLKYEVERLLYGYGGLEDIVMDILGEKGYSEEENEQMIEEVMSNIDKAVDEADWAVRELDYKKVTDAPYIFMEGGVGCKVTFDSVSESTLLVCTGTAGVRESSVLSAVINDLTKAVDKAADSAEETWFSTFRKAVLKQVR